MKKFVKAMSYKPKIPAVRSGECRQTIRGDWHVTEGDQILFHGWSGLPYRSKWDWRLRVDVIDAVPICVDYDCGISIYDCGTGLIPHETIVWHTWDDRWTNILAVQDFITPPTGFALRDLLLELNKDLSMKRYQIIRW